MKSVFSRASLVNCLLLVLLWQVLAIEKCYSQIPSGPSWQFGVNPSAPIAFSAVERYRRNGTAPYDFQLSSGQPVEATAYGLSASDFTVFHSSCQVYLYVPGRVAANPVLIFPKPEHQSMIDAPYQLGCATELRSGLSRPVLYASYVHDVTRYASLSNVPIKGADIYSFDLQPFLTDPNYSGAVNVRRLTTQPTNRLEFATNPSLAAASNMNWGGIMHMGATEMETDKGRFLVFTSNRDTLQNSNGSLIDNFNLFQAKILPDGSIGHINRFQYYTTTSAASAFNLRDGIGFSIQDRIADHRHWVLQAVSANGVWDPLFGYGTQSGMANHLATLYSAVPGDTTGAFDYVISTQYYSRIFNNGFGALSGAPLALKGVNNNDTPGGFGTYQPTQAGSGMLTLNIAANEDQPSWDQNTGQVIGKMSTPAAGRPGEFYAAYSPTCANTRNLTDGCWALNSSLGRYHSHIVLRTGLVDSQGRLVGVDPRNTSVWAPVIKDTNKYYSLVFPTPMLTWVERTSAPPHYGTTWASATGEPVAMVGTSDASNTDREPLECSIILNPPAIDSNVWRSSSFQNQRELGLSAHSPLMWVRDPSKISRSAQDSVCNTPLHPGDVGWMEIAITSEKTDTTRLNPIASSTEIERSLGVVRVGVPFNGGIDSSFSAFIPSDQPYKFRPLHPVTGLGMINHDGWHSPKPGEKRVGCGGCHNHKLNAAVPWQGTRASQPTYRPAELMNVTPYIRYDAQCNAVEDLDPNPTRQNPKWTNLFPKVQQYCGNCHATGQNGEPAFVVSTANATYDALVNTPNRLNSSVGSDSTRARQWAIPRMAMMSLACMAARGERTDGRDNTFYLAHQDLDFHLSPIHASIGLCSGNHPDGLAAANFVYDFCRWIDTGAHNDATYTNQQIDFDRFHPSVTGALLDRPGCTSAQGLRVGFWDDSGYIQSIEVKGVPAGSSQGFDVVRAPAGGLQNGFETFTEISQLGDDDDSVEVIATDMAGNRQKYAKTMGELRYECFVAADPRNGLGPQLPPTPTPTPTPTGGSGSGSGGSGNGGSPLVGLKTSSSRVGPGDFLRFTLSMQSLSGQSKAVVLGSASGSSPGQTWGGQHFALNNDRYFKRTQQSLKGSINVNGSSASMVLDLQVPRVCSRASRKALKHQAALMAGDGSVAAVSELKSITLVPGVSGRASNPLQKEIDKAQRDLSKARAKRAQASIRSASNKLNSLKKRQIKAKALGARLFASICD
ncbi:MAG: hypothetical protein K1X79_10095 [Oligoflexia bacterium]|nr:hypothetical protein [Oligoflexia bacterium]